jgi:hypothetical protein
MLHVFRRWAKVPRRMGVFGDGVEYAVAATVYRVNAEFGWI